MSEAALPYGFARRHGVIVRDGGAECAHLATAPLAARLEVQRLYGATIRFVPLAEAAFDEALRAAYQDSGNDAAGFAAALDTDLAALAESALGTGAAKISPRSPVSVAGGWQRREVAVELPSVAYAEAATFLAAAAAAEPPWRLREIDVRPAAEAGQGAWSLVLETLEKKRP